MKELSIEEKATRYDEVLGKAKRYYNEYKTRDNILYVEDMEDMFPELKESEDERAWLTKFIQDEINCICFDIRGYEDRIKLENLQRSLAWLGKQGEKGTNGDNKEIPNSAWSEEDEQYIIDTLNLLSFGCSSHSVGEVKDFLKSLKGRVGHFDDGYKVGFSAAKYNQWKPSEEQLHYLSWIANIKLGDGVVEQEVSKHLNKLYEDLLKLK